MSKHRLSGRGDRGERNRRLASVIKWGAVVVSVTLLVTTCLLINKLRYTAQGSLANPTARAGSALLQR